MMKSYDVFNGDADGICALVQLRLAEPKQSELITGVKRDISLLNKLPVEACDVTVLDISFEKNRNAVESLLAVGARVDYIDHHKTGDLIKHENLQINIDLKPTICTSLLVDKRLDGKYRAWAITAAYGDNLIDVAYSYGKESGFTDQELDALQELGTLINYNGYGEVETDLFFEPAELYKILVAYESPFDFIKEKKGILDTLRKGYEQDMKNAQQSKIIHETSATAVIELDNAKWAKRVSGVFGNDLANKFPHRAHAVIRKKDDDFFVISVRAPLQNKQGADQLVSKFPTGGGRKAAAGINSLPPELLDKFIGCLEKQYS
jgi:single-stranded DNA-specific DHH superfamily exonuclease